MILEQKTAPTLQLYDKIQESGGINPYP